MPHKRAVFRSGMAILVVAVSVAATSREAFAFVIPIDPAVTYLRTNLDAASNSPGLELASLGIAPGDTIILNRTGDYSRNADNIVLFPDNVSAMAAVFSGSATLLAPGQLNRVVDAIQAVGTFPIVTQATFNGGLSTDIAEDFFVRAEGIDVPLVVPLGATHLFISPNDSLFQDNVDPDGDYALIIRVIPEPSTALLLGAGLVGLATRRRSKRLDSCRTGECTGRPGLIPLASTGIG